MTSNPIHLDVHEQIECAFTVASKFYTDPQILGVEQSRIFRRTWQLVGMLDHPCGPSSSVAASDVGAPDVGAPHAGFACGAFASLHP